MKKIKDNIITILVIIIIILLGLWFYPLKMKKNDNGNYDCYNIFNHYVDCNDG